MCFLKGYQEEYFFNTGVTEYQNGVREQRHHKGNSGGENYGDQRAVCKTYQVSNQKDGMPQLNYLNISSYTTFKAVGIKVVPKIFDETVRDRKS